MIVDFAQKRMENRSRTTVLTQSGGGLSGGALFFAMAMALTWVGTGCASVGSPGGGPEDTLAPSVLSVWPEPFQKQFVASEIELVFDEYIALKNPAQQIFMSPPTVERPKAEVRGKRLRVELPADLKENTTYALSFGDAVVDFTAGNANRGLRYVFSTGSTIDSLEIPGVAIDVLEQKPLANVRAMLYRNDSSWTDSAVYHRLPDSYALSNEKGVFVLDFLSAGTYRIAAWVDANSDFQYDPLKESFGFVDELVQLEAGDSIPYAPLALSTARPKPAFRPGRQRYQGRIDLPLTLPVERVRIEGVVFWPEGIPARWAADTTGTIDTLRFFYAGEGVDSIRFVVSAQGVAPDTVQLAPRGNRVLTPKYALNPVESFGPVEQMVLEANLPFWPDTSASTLWIGPSGDSLVWKPRWIQHSPLRYTLEIPNKEPGSHSWRWLPGVVTDWQGQASDSLEFQLTVPSAAERAELKIKLEVPDSTARGLLELTKPDGTLFYSTSVKRDTTLMLGWIAPGAYRMRYIEDRNQNGQWDPVDWPSRSQPERLVWNPEAIELKANWEVEMAWKPQWGALLPVSPNPKK